MKDHTKENKITLESDEQCFYYAGLAELMSLEEALLLQPGELIVCPE